MLGRKMDLDMHAKLVQHDNDITAVQSTLYEIKATLKHLTDGQRTISKLIEAKTEHTVEIKYLTHGMERVFDELKKIDGRMGKVETLLEVKRQENTVSVARATGHGILETMREYWHVIAIFATAISFALSYFFGIKVKD